MNKSNIKISEFKIFRFNPLMTDAVRNKTGLADFNGEY